MLDQANAAVRAGEELKVVMQVVCNTRTKLKTPVNEKNPSFCMCLTRAIKSCYAINVTSLIDPADNLKRPRKSALGAARSSTS